MSDPKPVYEVVYGCIQLPEARDFFYEGDLLFPGDVVPEGAVSPAMLKSLLEQGKVRELQGRDAAAAQARVRARGKWNIDPSTVLDKTFEQLQIMIWEIDRNYDIGSIKNEKEAIALLTSEWDPSFREKLAEAPTPLDVLPVSQNNVKPDERTRFEDQARIADLKARAAANPHPKPE